MTFMYFSYLMKNILTWKLGPEYGGDRWELTPLASAPNWNT